MAVPVTRLSFTADSADEVADIVTRHGMRTRLRRPQSGLDYVADTVATGSLGVDVARCTATFSAAVDGSAELIVVTWLGGRAALDFGRYGATVAVEGHSTLYVPGAPSVVEMDDHVGLAVRLSPTEVGRAVEELTGLAPEALHFTSLSPVSAARGRLWGVTARMLWEELAAPAAGVLTPLVHQELIGTVAAAVVTAFPNTAMTRGYVPGPGYVGPATLRRALAYVDAHASLPITVADVAEAAGVGPAALRAAFRRHLDTTPSAHLRGVRLDAAHRDLVAADPTADATVASVAARWGFVSPSRFADSYRDRFGCAPGETLGR
ncbi:AraC family transcriptional regulator [Pseudonocardia sulfidoxydans NBRC 16205]|uniref:AraC family transcriptional regulator n=1 Tax=Pseudonocardia sulfidoxydans NBRC 16205 TaxID=1223511 RepID=A0A511DSD0_9PSEU|nr:helix-turn-helix domain-containing protein [Pseudonocardia sulfidoxydans]GEL25958.1 AraC family transcriptional regulator [Pseudonocardia sulfidoxydans NBRC 16205]